jgi:hypothetical protein
MSVIKSCEDIIETCSIFPKNVAFMNQLYLECTEMLRYALNKGLKIPVSVSATLAAFSIKKSDIITNQKKEADIASKRDESIPQHFFTEEMGTLENQAKQLTKIHGILSGIVKPATPRSIVATKEIVSGKIRSSRSKKLIKWLRIFIIASLFLFMTTVVFVKNPELIDDIIAKITSKDDPSKFLGDIVYSVVNGINYLTAAFLGAAFFALFTANRYITRWTYDPAFEKVYLIRIFLGVVSGVILAIFIDAKKLFGYSNNAAQFTNPKVLQALLALLGGFSADAVYRILRRLVATFEALVEGKSSDIIAAREQIIESKNLAEKTIIGGKLTAIKHQIKSGDKKTSISQINRLLEELNMEETDESNN